MCPSAAKLTLLKCTHFPKIDRNSNQYFGRGHHFGELAISFWSHLGGLDGCWLPSASWEKSGVAPGQFPGLNMPRQTAKTSVIKPVCICTWFCQDEKDLNVCIFKACNRCKELRHLAGWSSTQPGSQCSRPVADSSDSSSQKLVRQLCLQSRFSWKRLE